MRKILGTLGATVLAGITAAAIATPAAAADCVPDTGPLMHDLLSREYETVVVTPAQPAIPAVPEVSHVETTDWVTEIPAGEDWVQVDEREVIDVEAVPAWTEVVTNDDEIPAGYEQTDWILEAPADGRTWVQIAEREVIDVEAVPAQGEPTITIDNPDYVPEQTIEHPAVYETIHHEAITHTEWKYVKHGGPGEIWVSDNTWKYLDSNGNGYNTWIEALFDGDWPIYERTSKTKTVIDQAAWDEQVLVSEAWTETIPAQGEPTIVVDNPDYVPAVEQVSHLEYKFAWHQAYVPPTTYTVEHPAIEQVSHMEFIFERTVIDVAAVPAVPAVPAVTEQRLVTPVVPAEVCPVEPNPAPIVEPAASSTSDRRIVTPDVPVVAEDTLADTGADSRGRVISSIMILMGLALVLVASRIRRRG